VLFNQYVWLLSREYLMPALSSPDHGSVLFYGADATSFLQSQFTNDVAALAVGAWQWQGYCSAKGRLHATFALLRLADDRYLAVVHRSVLAFLVKRLTMFRLRSKLTIAHDETLAVVLCLDDVIGEAAASNSKASDAAPASIIDLGHGRSIRIQAAHPANASFAGANEQPDAAVNANTDAFMQQWNARGIEAAQPEITAATNEMFVPQMIGWDVIVPGGGVSFSKGCYPGQEVVARAHYRGAVKRHLERVTLPDTAQAAPGAALTLSDGRDAEICNAAQSPSGDWLALVVVSGASA
jgi:tRNA-modifying protein YgfZ